MEQPLALSVAGWDPCGGAGLAADIKTFEANLVTGMGACTALTAQTHDRFYSLRWISQHEIEGQLRALFDNYRFEAVKFGIVESTQIIVNCIAMAIENNPRVKVVWDPVMRATAGHDFHRELNLERLTNLLKRLTLVTPNIREAQMIFGTSHPGELWEIVKEREISPVLLKGGHSRGVANDFLIERDGISTIEGEKFEDSRGKHGSGCVFSAAACAFMARGESLFDACVTAKRYTEGFILSSPGLLGWHKSTRETGTGDFK